MPFAAFELAESQVMQEPTEDHRDIIFYLCPAQVHEMGGGSVRWDNAEKFRDAFLAEFLLRLIHHFDDMFAGGATQAAAGAIIVGATGIISCFDFDEGDVYPLDIRAA